MRFQPLRDILYINLDWHPSRILLLAELISGVIKTGTVRIKDLALTLSSKGNTRAKIAKIERLLLHQQFDFTIIGKIICSLLLKAAKSQKVKIAIDRTNWRFGQQNLNYFVAAVIIGNISVPIAWILLDKKGNSSTAERIELMTKITKIIPKEQIEIILADREFTGEAWLQYLIKTQELPFAIRLKKSEKVERNNGKKTKLRKYFKDMQPQEMQTVETKIYGDLAVKITCLQMEKDYLILASNIVIGEEALLTYKQRWSIERSFKSLKKSGFNIEDTHITDQSKLSKLFAVLSIAMALCVAAGKIKHATIPIKIKKHGRLAYSLFTYGFDWIRNYFYAPQNNDLRLLYAKLRDTILSVPNFAAQ
jgi:hypothetical protein